MAKKPVPKIKGLGVTPRIDTDKVKEMFIASPHMDWVRFAEEQGWDSGRSRSDYPVKTWQDEKRRIISEKQTDILSGLIFERRFKWTHSIIETLDEYPKSIDMAKKIADAKMGQIAQMYQSYTEYIKSKKYADLVSEGKTPPKHDFEKVSMTEISMLLKGMKDITEAKLKALMLDKWAVARLDIPAEELTGAGDKPADQRNNHRIMIEGRTEPTPEEFQGWFDKWIDKPPVEPESEK